MRPTILLCLLLTACAPHAPNGRLAIVLATSAHDTMAGTGPAENVIRDLRRDGWEVRAVPLPCHDGLPCRVQGLEGWAAEIANGNTALFQAFCQRLDAAIAPYSHASLVGVSRGAYAALRCARDNPRITAVAALAPVTDLWQLEEFRGVPHVVAYDLLRVNIPVLVRIARSDSRVGSQAGMQYAHFIGAELDVINTRGHVAPDYGEAAQWLNSH